MAIKTFFIGLSTALAALACTGLTACSDSDNNDPADPAEKPGETTDNLSDILFDKTNIGDGRQEFEIKGKYSLPKGVYTLRGWVYVTDGAELTLAPGTVIRGEKSTKAALIVEPGGKLWAEGTQAEPIVLTSAQAPGMRRPGDWGGLIVCGNARNNQGKMAIEGGPRTVHGGSDDNDCSGALAYVRVEFAGYPFAVDQEINGVTFGSVGRGTKVSHVQVSYSNDDSFEWFGGSVNADHLVAFRGWDDDFDTDNGFSGRVQFCYGVRDPRIADQSVSNGFESDNCADAATKEPFTQAVFSNVTFVGPRVQQGFSNTSDYITAGNLNPDNGSRLGQFQAAMQIRRNSRLSCFNSLAVGYPVGLIVENDKGAQTQQGATDGLMRVASVYFADMGILGSDKNKSFKDAYSANASDLDETRESFSASYFKSVASNRSFDSAASLVLSPEYRPLGGSPLLGKADFSDPLCATGFDRVSYIGAFSGPSDPWLDAWTCFDPQSAVY